MKNLYLIIGPSGSGKTTLATTLCEARGLKQVESFTTRPPRYPGEIGHRFVCQEMFDSLTLVAYTEYNDYEYGVTKSILDESDIYVIDPRGADELLKKYVSQRHIFVIWMNTSPDECKSRMFGRGDSISDVQRRIDQDRESFTSFDSFRIMSQVPGMWVNTDGKSIDDITKEVLEFVDLMTKPNEFNATHEGCGLWNKIARMFIR